MCKIKITPLTSSGQDCADKTWRIVLRLASKQFDFYF